MVQCCQHLLRKKKPFSAGKGKKPVFLPNKAEKKRKDFQTIFAIKENISICIFRKKKLNKKSPGLSFSFLLNEYKIMFY